MPIEKKLFLAEIKSFDDKELILEHFISTEKRDDGGDIMRADGMKLRGKPVVLFQHGLDPQKGMEPIAQMLGISVGINKNGQKGLIAKTKYYDGGKLTPPDNTGQRLYEKAKQGFMPNWSIGWVPLKYNPIPEGGREVTEWELHEYSQVAVGMNDEATTDIKSILGGQPLPVIQIKEDATPEGKPLPNARESEDDFVKRCIPVVLEDGTTDDPAQAAAICHSKWRETNKEKSVETLPTGPKFFKAIIDQCALSLPAQAISTLNNALMNELFNQGMTSQESSDKIVSDLLTEYIGLAMPYMQAFVDACRKPENKEKTFDEIKALTSTKTELLAAVPAPVAESVLDISNQLPAQEPVLSLADQKAEVLIISDSQNSKIDLGMSVEDFRKSLTEAVKGTINLAIRKEQGRLD